MQAINKGSKRMSSSIAGRCLCGAVSYDCIGEQIIGGHCHCVDCQKSSGTGRSSHMGVPRQAVTISGETTVYTAPTDTGNTVSRHFCPTGGTPVFSTNYALADMVFLWASCLDDLENFQPGVVV
jgi:hypothetical protein